MVRFAFALVDAVQLASSHTISEYVQLAEPLLHDAINNYNHALVRENSLYLSWLAEDYIQLGEINHAATVATEVLTLANRTNSARTSDRLHHLAKLLKRYGTVRSVADFLDLYRDLAA